MEKNKIMMISIIVLLVALLGTIVGVALFVINQMKKVDNPDEASVDKQPAVVELKREQITPLKFDDPISTNLLMSSDGTNHVIKIGIGLGVNNIDKKKADAFLTTLTDNEVVIRDTVIGILHNKTNEELSKPDGKEILKAEILESLQEIFTNNLIVEVNMGEMYIVKTP